MTYHSDLQTTKQRWDQCGMTSSRMAALLKEYGFHAYSPTRLRKVLSGGERSNPVLSAVNGVFDMLERKR